MTFPSRSGGPGRASPRTRTSTGTGTGLILAGIVILGFNLRPAAVSVGPLLPEVTQGLDLGQLGAGVLTALPVLTFGIFGALAPVVARVVGLHRVTFLAVAALTAGLVLRSLAGTAGGFLTFSALALAGMAFANVLLPALVRRHFPSRIGVLTSLYTTSMALGLTSASAATVPLADALGGWRWGLGIWAVAAGLAALPWLALIRHDSHPTGPERTISLTAVARTRLGWAMVLTFGIQSLQAYTIFGWFARIYRDAGVSATDAGLLLGVITGVSIPLSLVIPSLAARQGDPTRLMLGLIGCYPLGYLGMIFAPRQGALLWALLLGVGASVFPLVLTLIGLRSRTAGGATALSGLTQGAGYVIAAAGPFGFGWLHDRTGGWELPLALLCVLSLAAAALAMVVCRAGSIEDELAARVRAG